MKATLSAAFFLLCGMLAGQQVVAPTPVPAGKPGGEDVNGYNVANSFEIGYRMRSAGGNIGKYRSDVNYGNGVRLLSGSLSIHSREGQGRLFDELVLNTLGLGNDPYQSATLRLQKNRIYRHDMHWRLSDYFNPGLTVAGGQHLLDTQRRMQDHDFTLLPQSKFKLLAGYTRNSIDGPALTTIQLFETRGDEFPLFSDIRRVRNEFRLGGEFEIFGAKVHWLRGWDNFREDTRTFLPGPSLGNDPGNPTTLSNLRRDEPYHGNSPYWRVSLIAESKHWAASGRFTHAMTRRDFVFDQSAAGTGRFGDAQSRQTTVFGTGRRPATAADFTLSAHPSSRLTLSNHTSFHHTRIEGDASLLQFDNFTSATDLLYFGFLGMRTVANTTDANLRAARWLGLRAGHHYSTRRVRSVEQVEVAGSLSRIPAEQENVLNAGLAGIRLQPVRPLTISLDGEIGRADRPFFPIADRNHHALGARVQYRKNSLLLAASARSNYNANSVNVSSHSSRARHFSADASWTPAEWFAFYAGYSRLHLDTASGILYFATAQLIERDRSIYVSNIHAANVGARLLLRGRADLYFGYSHVEDTGDGRNTPEAGAGARLGPFLAAQTFPLAYRTPLARLSLRLHEKLRWNFGYQYYGYREEFLRLQNYRAHTGYSSLSWSF